MAKIIIPTPLRKLTGNEATFETPASTVGEVLRELTAKFPDLRSNIIDDNGELRSFVRIYLGNEDIKQLDNTLTEVNEDSVISIIPAIAGGI